MSGHGGFFKGSYHCAGIGLVQGFNVTGKNDDIGVEGVDQTAQASAQNRTDRLNRFGADDVAGGSIGEDLHRESVGIVGPNIQTSCFGQGNVVDGHFPTAVCATLALGGGVSEWQVTDFAMPAAAGWSGLAFEDETSTDSDG